jgi:LCP family protein required for cell wall assembly
MQKTPKPDFIYDPIVDKRHNLKKFARGSKKPMSRWKKIFLTIGCIIAIGLVGFGLFAFKNIVKIAPNFFKFESKLKGEDEGRINILLLGIGDPGHDGGDLADTNILVSVNTRDNKIAMVSIPRDTRVKVSGHGNQKINAASAYGGVDLAKSTVENFLDVPVHYYVRANFTGLKQAVDAVGGIEVDNKYLLHDPEYPCDKNQWKSCGFKMQPGRQKVDGATALKYARCRKGTCGDDFGRAERQQEVIAAIRAKALSTETILNPAKLTSLIQAAGDNVKTDLSVQGMLRLNDLTKDIANEQIINAVFSIQPNGFLEPDPAGSSDLVPIDSTLTSIQTFVKDIYRLGPIWKENSKIVIQNGTTTAGLGGKLETRLNKEKLPFTITQVINALTRDHTTTQLIDYTGGTKNNTKSHLEGVLKVTATTPEKEVKNPPQDFVIIIGSDYTNYLPSPSPSTNSSSRDQD